MTELNASGAAEPMTPHEALTRLAQYRERKGLTVASYDSGTERTLHEIATTLAAEVRRFQGWLGDYEATQARNAELKAEVERLHAELDADLAAGHGAKHWHDTYQQTMNEVDEFLGILLDLLPGATDEGMDAYDQIPRAIEKLTAELDKARTEAGRRVAPVEMLALKRQRDEAQAEVKQWRATFSETALRDSLARLARTEAERDEARASQQRSDDLLVGAHNDLCEALDVRHRPLLDVIQHAATIRAERDHLKDERNHAYTALRGVLYGTPATLRQGVELAAKTIRDHDAERDRLAEQVKRAREELRKGAAYLVRRADLDADLSPSESRALAHDLRGAALDGTEAGR